MSYTEPPTLEDIEALSKSIVDALPAGLGKYIGKLKIIVEDFPDAYIEQELELEPDGVVGRIHLVQVEVVLEPKLGELARVPRQVG